MERVAFLLEETGERIGCLLNPESLIRRRTAGVRPRRITGGLLTGAGLADDQLIFTGGGMTEIQMDLLFDVSVQGSTIVTEDVRDLTQPLWNLAENSGSDREYGRPPVARFIWGKSWNIPGVIVAVSERLEYFTASGSPRRSWIRLKMLRVAETDADLPMRSPMRPDALIAANEDDEVDEDALIEAAMDDIRVYEVIGGTGDDEGTGSSERPDDLAWRLYGDPTLWKLLLVFNDIDDPLNIPPGTRLLAP